MSDKALAWALDDAPILSTEKGRPDTTARSILMVLAELAQDDGEVHPSLMRIEYRTGYDRRTIQRGLRRLEVGELIDAEGAADGCAVYRLALRLKRPAGDWAALERDEHRQRDADTERQRMLRIRRAVPASGPHRGFRSDKPGLVYVLEHMQFGAVKVGISNGEGRPRQFGRHGWQVVSYTRFADGAQALAVERAVLRHIRRDLCLAFFLSPAEMNGMGGCTETFEADALPTAKLRDLVAEEARKVIGA